MKVDEVVAKGGFDTTPGNANCGFGATVLKSDQSLSTDFGALRFGGITSQTIGTDEAYLGVKDNQFGIGLNYSALSLEAGKNVTAFGYGFQIAGSLEVGTAPFQI